MRLWFAVLLPSLAFVPFSSAGDAAEPPCATLVEQLLTDCLDGHLDQFDSLSAAIVAGGVDSPDSVDQTLREFDRLAGRINLEATAKLPPAERSRSLARQMHEHILRGGYEVSSSRVDLGIAAGDYNCLSAAVIFDELCRRADLDVEIWSQSGHVFCRLSDDPTIRIEPSSREWAEGQVDRETISGDASSRQLSQVQLLGKFFYNRGIQQLRHKDFAEGISQLEIALELDAEDADARANLLAGLNNWAVALAKQGDDAAAAKLIEHGLAIDPTFEPLRSNAAYLRIGESQ